MALEVSDTFLTLDHSQQRETKETPVAGADGKLSGWYQQPLLASLWRKEEAGGNRTGGMGNASS